MPLDHRQARIRKLRQTFTVGLAAFNSATHQRARDGEIAALKSTCHLDRAVFQINLARRDLCARDLAPRITELGAKRRIARDELAQ